MSGYMYNQNGNLITTSEKVKASTCKIENYKAVWVKDGKASVKKPLNFDFFRDKIYIVGVGNVIFPEIQEYSELPPEPNEEYRTRELFDSLINLCHSFNVDIKTEYHIKQTIKWCKKYGMPFFGNNGLYCGDVSSCYRDTGYPIGFNFRTFFMDVHHLYDIFVKACCIDENLNISDKIELSINPIRKKTNRNTENIENAIISALNIAMFQKQQQYTFVNHELVYEISFKTLISLAYYQLAILLLSPGGLSAKRCKQCGALFTTDHAKRDYCFKHSPQSYYAMKKRMIKAPDTN